MGKPQWQFEKHLRHLIDGDWLQMLDPEGRILEGITGKRGVTGGSKIGCDFISMAPGSKFPTHTHMGDHEIYIILGRGVVNIGGISVVLKAGNVIHIPANVPHGIWVPKEVEDGLVFIAFGYPHRDILADDRMAIANEADIA